MIESKPQSNVVVVGLGYVGLTLAIHLAEKELEVQGVEIRKNVLDKLTKGESTFWEPNLNSLIEKNLLLGRFTVGFEIESQDIPRVFIITVGTPLYGEKLINMEPLKRATKEVSRAINNGDLVLLRSTVGVGSTREFVKPILDSTGKKFYLAFAPERTLEGTALLELNHLPQIIGGIDEASLEVASKFFESIDTKVIKVSNSETAEMIKLVDNMQRDSRFAISNEVASMCNLNSQIRAREVILKGKIDYPRTDLHLPGPVGGPCLEKDPYILVESMYGRGFKDSLSISARQTNFSVIPRGLSSMLELIEKRKLKNPKISLLGMAFKGQPRTDDLRGSSSIQIIEFLRKEMSNCQIKVWDPLVQPSDLMHLTVDHYLSIAETIVGADLVVFVTNHQELNEIDINELSKKLNTSAVLYDFLDRFEIAHPLPNGVTYFGWGNMTNKACEG